MAINQDYEDLFKILNISRAKYLVVGAYALIYYTEPRYTKDLDIWVEPTLKNAKLVWKSLDKFGAPLKSVTLEDFCNPDQVYQIGVEPNRIDIMMGVPGLKFSTAWKHRVRTNYGGERINIISLKDLIKSKKKANRAQDKIDLLILKDITRRKTR